MLSRKNIHPFHASRIIPKISSRSGLHQEIHVSRMGNHESRINKNLNQVSREIKTITLHEKAMGDSQKNNASQPLREAGLRKWFFYGSGSNRVLTIFTNTLTDRTWTPKMCRPSANTENSRRAQEKPLVPRVTNSRRSKKMVRYLF